MSKENNIKDYPDKEELIQKSYTIVFFLFHYQIKICSVSEILLNKYTKK